MKLSKKAQKKFDQIHEAMHLNSLESNINRARGVTVGTAGGGSVELSLRGNSADTMYAILQPSEVIELIHQLSGAVGCHIHIKPREDFSSWRVWKQGTDFSNQIAYDKPATLEDLAKAVQAITGNNQIALLQQSAPSTQLAEASIMPEPTEEEREKYKLPPNGSQDSNWAPHPEYDNYEWTKLGSQKQGAIQPGIIPEQMPLDQIIKETKSNAVDSKKQKH